MVSIATTPSRRKRDDWLLVLSSANIPAQAVRVGQEWAIVVADTLELAARANLSEYERENVRPATDAARAIDFGPSSAGLAVGATLLALHAASFLDPGRVYWLRAGRASAWRILDGELWRSATALTLHADASHVLGNAFGSAVFVSAVCRSFGAGLGVLAVVLGGVVGNLLNALWRGAPHLSIGASTGVFAAVGILAGAQLVRRRQLAQDWRRSWLPFGAAIAILAMLGVGPDSDFLAHLFGVLAGVGIGAAVATALPNPPGPAAQAAAGAAAAAIIAGAWAFALG
jgi:membrane associated rhomboid family serine protease